MVNSRNNLSDSENYSLASESDNALKPNMNSSDYLVAFSGNTQNYCVGLVDMVNSTKIAATLGNGKISEYY